MPALPRGRRHSHFTRQLLIVKTRPHGPVFVVVVVVVVLVVFEFRFETLNIFIKKSFAHSLPIPPARTIARIVGS